MMPTLIGLVASSTSMDMMLARRHSVPSRCVGSSGVDGAAGRRATSRHEEGSSEPASAVAIALRLALIRFRMKFQDEVWAPEFRRPKQVEVNTQSLHAF